MAALNVLADASEALLACVCEALDDIPTTLPGMAGCPCRSGVVPGNEIAWDGCDTGCAPLDEGKWSGQLAVKTNRIFASDFGNFPREAAVVADLNGCKATPVMAAELVVSVIRCAPIGDGQCPPTVDELAATARQQNVDMVAVRKGILCCLAGTDPTRPRGRRFSLGGSTTIGPQGGCVGFEQTVTVDLGY
jgi:hypothetical protein